MSNEISRGLLLDRRAEKPEDPLTNTLFWVIIVILAVFTILRGFVFTTVLVSGDSMLPTLESGDYLIGNRLYAELGIYERGDIVVVDTDSEDPSSGGYKKIIKRIIGLAGDEIDVRAGRVYVNGEYLEEEYLYPNMNTEQKEYSFPYTVKEGEIFVLGDNRAVSKDSRSLDYQRLSASAVFAVIPKWAVENKSTEPYGFGCED